jgi:hypothetical protein
MTKIQRMRFACRILRQEYRHTLIIFNTYCFSATSMITRTRLNIMFIHTFPVFTCALDGGEWSVSRRGRFNPEVTGCDSNWLVIWAGTRVCLEALEKIKFFWTCRRIQLFLFRRPARNPDDVIKCKVRAKSGICICWLNFSSVIHTHTATITKCIFFFNHNKTVISAGFIIT